MAYIRNANITQAHKVRLFKKAWRIAQPVIDVHHIVNIKDCAQKETNDKSFASINDYNNICFIVRHPNHDAMHALEQELNGHRHHDDIFYNREIDEKYIFRIQAPEGVKCIFGFDKMLYDKEYLGIPIEKKIEKERSNSGYHRNNQHKRYNRTAEKQTFRRELNNRW